MAAPTLPSKPGFSRSFWQLAADIVTIASNLSIPYALDATSTTVISGTTAASVVAAFNKQRDLM